MFRFRCSQGIAKLKTIIEQLLKSTISSRVVFKDSMCHKVQNSVAHYSIHFGCIVPLRLKTVSLARTGDGQPKHFK